MKLSTKPIRKHIHPHPIGDLEIKAAKRLREHLPELAAMPFGDVVYMVHVTMMAVAYYSKGYRLEQQDKQASH